MIYLDPQTRIPRLLLTMECCGVSLMIIGIIESFGLELPVPAALRFEGYGLLLIGIGSLMILPLMVFLGSTSTNPARPRRPLF